MLGKLYFITYLIWLLTVVVFRGIDLEYDTRINGESSVSNVIKYLLNILIILLVKDLVATICTNTYYLNGLIINTDKEFILDIIGLTIAYLIYFSFRFKKLISILKLNRAHKICKLND